MTHDDPGMGNAIIRAQEKLVTRFGNHPDVSLIDIGYDPGSDAFPYNVVLRIHVRWRWIVAPPEERVAFPTEVDGIPVIVIPGDYRPETNSPATGGRM